MKKLIISILCIICHLNAVQLRLVYQQLVEHQILQDLAIDLLGIVDVAELGLVVDEVLLQVGLEDDLLANHGHDAVNGRASALCPKRQRGADDA